MPVLLACSSYDSDKTPVVHAGDSFRVYSALGPTNLLRPQVYCSGESGSFSSPELGGSQVFIEGGTFIGNTALEVGGAVMIWGPPTVVTITGGLFKNNYAT